MLVVVQWMDVAFVIVTSAIFAAFARSLPNRPSEVGEAKFPTELRSVSKIITSFTYLLPVRCADIINIKAHLVTLRVWVHGKPPRIPKADSIEFLTLSIAAAILITTNTFGIISKWVVGRNITCISETDDSSENAAQVLGFVAYSSFANRDIHVAILAKFNLSRVVHRKCCGGSVEQDYFRIPINRLGGGIIDPS